MIRKAIAVCSLYSVVAFAHEVEFIAQVDLSPETSIHETLPEVTDLSESLPTVEEVQKPRSVVRNKKHTVLLNDTNNADLEIEWVFDRTDAPIAQTQTMQERDAEYLRQATLQGFADVNLSPDLAANDGVDGDILLKNSQRFSAMVNADLKGWNGPALHTQGDWQNSVQAIRQQTQSFNTSANALGFSIQGTDPLPGNAKVAHAQNIYGSQVSKVTIRGRLVAPGDRDLSGVNIRVAGTYWQFKADADGTFMIPDVPAGAKLSVLIWDDNNTYARQLLPLSATSEEVSIQLATQNQVLNVAAASGISQNIMDAGFCGRMKATDPMALVGAKIIPTFKDGQVVVFSKSGLPMAKGNSLSQSGQFCFFNVKNELTEFQVQLPNGGRRTFTVHTQPTVFLMNQTFDLESAIYRPVNFWGLTDPEVAVQSAQTKVPTSIASEWITKQNMGVWAQSYGMNFRPDKSYGAYEDPLNQESDTVKLLPMGQEFVELYSESENESEKKSFTLASIQDLKTNQSRLSEAKVTNDPSEPLNLSMTNEFQMDALLAAADIPNSDKGSALVSLNLGSVANEDVVVSLTNTWTGQEVAKFQILSDSKSRILRGVFVDLPNGQFSMTVTDKSGKLIWIDTVRGHHKSIQVLNLELK